MQYFNFKNMLAYEIKEIEKTALLDHDQLLQAVLRMPYRPLSHGQDKLTTFSAVNGNNSDQPQYVYPIEESGGKVIGYALCVNMAKRDLPAKFVANEVARRVKKLEEQTGQELEKADLKRIKEETISELIDKAFPKEKEIDLFIDIKNSLVFVGATSETAAEQCFALLRKVLNSFPAVPLVYDNDIESVLNGIFLKGTIEISNTEVHIAPKFKLSEYDSANYNVTNNLTECPLESLQELVREKSLTTVQLELITPEANFIVVKPKAGKNNTPTYKGVDTHLQSLLEERMEEDAENQSSDAEGLQDEYRRFSAEHLIKTMKKIVDYSDKLFN